MTEPLWMTYGPEELEPPDNYIPDDLRAALDSLAEWLESDMQEVRDQLAAATSECDGDMTKAVYDAHAAWREATRTLADEIMKLWDATVGNEEN